MIKPCSVIALLSDFGLNDAFVGIVKGTMLSTVRDLTLLDICHEVEPQNVEQGSFLLATCLGYFPEGTVFWAVVDPGVGGKRRAIVVRGHRYFYVGPDNGLFTHCLLKDEPIDAVHIDEKRWGLPNCSITFHGRDIFAPVAAHLASGVDISEFGPSLSVDELCKLKDIDIDLEGANVAKIVHIDIYGNLITNWHCERGSEIKGLKFGGRFIAWASTYSAVPAGEMLVYRGSSGYLEIGANCASAHDILNASIGDKMEIVS